MPTYDPTATYKIINRKSDRALSIHAAGTENGARAILWEFVNAEDQLWHIVDIGNGFCKLINKHGRALSTLNGGTSNGTIVHLWDYLTTFPDQHWLISAASDGFVKITNRNGGRAVSCLDGGTTDDTPIHLWDYLGGFDDQDWSIVPVPQFDSRQSFRIMNRRSNRALSVHAAGSANGSRIVLWDFVNAEDQLWHVIDLQNGFYKLVNNHSGRVLSTLYGGTDNGTIIHLWDDLTTFPDQEWAINPVNADFVKITNRKSGRAVSCFEGGTANNTTIHLWQYLGGFDDQDWILHPVTDYVDVDANVVISEISPYMTGVCLEDVNHEVYGGIYSQMIFGESFQEPPAYDSNAFYKIINKKSLKALSVFEHESANGAHAVIRTFASEEDQLWRVIDIGDGFYRIANKQSGKVLSTLNGGSTNETIIHIWDDLTSFPDQHWAIGPGTGFVPIMNRNGRRVVSCVFGGTDDNTWLHLFDYKGAFSPQITDQDWSIEPVTPLTRPEVSGMWRSLRKGSATGTYSIDHNTAFIKGAASQEVTYAGGVGEIGIENQSLNRWGMNVQASRPYEGFLYVQTSAPATIYLALESRNGDSVYAEVSLLAINPQWSRYDFTLTPNANDGHGRFAIKLKQPGSIKVGYVFLQPGSWGRFNDLPVRKDIVEGLIAQGNTVLRFGGSSVNGSGYRWKNMIGPPASRPATGGTFYPYASNGWGIFDFLNLVESAGIVGVPALDINETAADISDFMDYVAGSTATVWGRQRADDGHPEPYTLKYLQLGNEQQVDGAYFEQFKQLAPIIWNKDPEIILIVGDWSYDDVISNRYYFAGGHVTTLAGHQQILELAKVYGREVWFDCHVWTDDVDLGLPQEQRYDAKVLKQVAALHSLHSQLRSGSPGANFRLVVFELNANSHDHHRALGNALAIGMMQRLGNEIEVIASANALQPDQQNDNGWDQGLLFFNASQTWCQPAYFVTQMKAMNYLPLAVRANVSGRESVTLDVTALKSADGTILALHVVNTIDVARTYTIHLGGFEPLLATAHVTTLTGPQSGRNTSANPNAIIPSEADVPYSRVGNTVTVTFAPSSFTILRLQ